MKHQNVERASLYAEVVAKGYAAQRWLTHRQAEAAGGNVRRDEKAIFRAASQASRASDHLLAFAEEEQ